jgi:hypothetical protein
MATCKLHVVRRGGEEAIAKPCPYEQEPDIKASQADKTAKDVKIPKATVTLACKSGG